MRVIKRKIIWDPDVPETGKSFAQYASSKSVRTSVSPTRAPSPTPAPTPAPAAAPVPKTLKVRVKATSPTLPIKKEAVAKKARASTPKELTTSTKAAAQSKALEVTRPSTPAKRRSQTPNTGLANGSTQKKKKVSEIDRLMGDEGAANMIHAVEHEQREMSGGEVPNKPLMRKRAMTITGRVSSYNTDFNSNILNPSFPA